MKTNLRAGLVGLGAMGRHHSRVLSQLDGVVFVGAADPGISAGEAPPGVRHLASVDSLLAEGLDMCVIAVPTKYHVDVALQMAEHGVAVLIEKPLASTVAHGQQIVDAFSPNSLFAGVGHIERFNPAIRELRKRLDNEELGEVFHITTTRVGPFPARIADVGVIFDLASHDIDLVQWISGSKYRELFARTAHRSGRSHEDLVSVTGILDNEVVVDHRVDWLSPFKERRTVVTGEAGSLVADTLTADLTHFKNGDFDGGWSDLNQFKGVAQGDSIRYAINKKEPLLAELEAFRDAVQGKPTDLSTVAEGLEVVRVAERIAQSALNATFDLGGTYTHG